MEANHDGQGYGNKIETADGNGVFLFRYNNPQVPNRNPNSPVSKEELVRSWFTDSPESLKTYILMRPPGGSIVVVEAPKDRLEEMKAINHPVAKDMDIEPVDNYIVPQELLLGARSIPFDVSSGNPRKFLFKDLSAIRNAVDEVVSQLKER